MRPEFDKKLVENWKRNHFAGVTQLVEYLVANQIVVGSSPITRFN
jgi:hypothetical protein